MLSRFVNACVHAKILNRLNKTIDIHAAYGKISKDVVSQWHLGNFYPYELLWYRAELKHFRFTTFYTHKYTILFTMRQKLVTTFFMSPYWFGSAIYESFSTARDEKKCIRIFRSRAFICTKSAYAKMQYGKIHLKKWKTTINVWTRLTK